MKIDIIPSKIQESSQTQDLLKVVEALNNHEYRVALQDRDFSKIAFKIASDLGIRTYRSMVTDSVYAYQWAMKYPEDRHFMRKHVTRSDMVVKWLTTWPEDRDLMLDRITDPLWMCIWCDTRPEDRNRFRPLITEEYALRWYQMAKTAEDYKEMLSRIRSSRQALAWALACPQEAPTLRDYITDSEDAYQWAVRFPYDRSVMRAHVIDPCVRIKWARAWTSDADYMSEGPIRREDVFNWLEILRNLNLDYDYMARLRVHLTTSDDAMLWFMRTGEYQPVEHLLTNPEDIFEVMKIMAIHQHEDFEHVRAKLPPVADIPENKLNLMQRSLFDYLQRFPDDTKMYDYVNDPVRLFWLSVINEDFEVLNRDASEIGAAGLDFFDQYNQTPSEFLRK